MGSLWPSPSPFACFCPFARRHCSQRCPLPCCQRILNRWWWSPVADKVVSFQRWEMVARWSGICLWGEILWSQVVDSLLHLLQVLKKMFNETMMVKFCQRGKKRNKATLITVLETKILSLKLRKSFLSRPLLTISIIICHRVKIFPFNYASRRLWNFAAGFKMEILPRRNGERY